MDDIDLFPDFVSGVDSIIKSAPLFLKDNKGRIRVWQCCIRGSNIHRRSGLLNKKMKETVREVHTNASGRSIEEQCKLEMESEIKKKLDAGYAKSIEECEKIVRPMLARIYKPEEISSWPVIVQVKLDGIRCFAMYNMKEIILRSRENNVFPQEFRNLKKQVKCLFKYLPPDSILDGELYYDELYKLASIVKSFEDHSDVDKVKYCIFDIILSHDLPYYKRYDIILDAMHKASAEISSIELVLSYLAYNDSEVQNFFRVFRSFDPPFEGIMVRDPYSFYQRTRCSSLLKLKEFYDEECTIIDVEEGEGTDKGLAIFKVVDNSGNEIRVRPKANNQDRKKWYERKEEIIGKKCTVTYFRKTEDKYIMPVAIVRDYE
jgi:ATP-dependent DNA ligase